MNKFLYPCLPLGHLICIPFYIAINKRVYFKERSSFLLIHSILIISSRLLPIFQERESSDIRLTGPREKVIQYQMDLWPDRCVPREDSVSLCEVCVFLVFSILNHLYSFIRRSTTVRRRTPRYYLSKLQNRHQQNERK